MRHIEEYHFGYIGRNSSRDHIVLVTILLDLMELEEFELLTVYRHPQFIKLCLRHIAIWSDADVYCGNCMMMYNTDRNPKNVLAMVKEHLLCRSTPEDK